MVIPAIRSARELTEREGRENVSQEGATTAITRLASREKVSWKGQLCRDQAAAVGNLEETQEHLGHSDKNRRQRCERSHTVITPWKEQDPAFSLCL